MGSKQGGLVALQQLLRTLPFGTIKCALCPDDRSDTRTQYESFVSLASQSDIPLHLVRSVNETTELIRAYAPEVVIVHGWYRRIPVTKFPGIKFFGFHYSPLPRYRGNSPLIWQIINGELRSAVSFFLLTEGIDDGDLVDQAFFDLTPNEGIADALNKAENIMLCILENFIPQWLSGNIATRPQPNIPASYGGLRLPEDGRISWHAGASHVHNFIRAQSRPYPGAYSLLVDGRVVRFWRSEVDSRSFYGAPGAVVEVADDGITVACGTGAIKVLNAEFDTAACSVMPPVLRSLKVRFQ